MNRANNFDTVQTVWNWTHNRECAYARTRVRVREYQVRVRVHSSLTRTFTSFYSDFRAFFNCEVDSLTRTMCILDGRSQVEHAFAHFSTRACTEWKYNHNVKCISWYIMYIFDSCCSHRSSERTLKFFIPTHILSRELSPVHSCLRAYMQTTLLPISRPNTNIS